MILGLQYAWYLDDRRGAKCPGASTPRHMTIRFSKDYSLSGKQTLLIGDFFMFLLEGKLILAAVNIIPNGVDLDGKL